MLITPQATIDKWIRWHQAGASVNRIWKLEKQWGPCSRKRVARILREAGVLVQRNTPRRPKPPPPEVMRVPERKKPVFTSSIPLPTKGQLMAGSAWVGKV